MQFRDILGPSLPLLHTVTVLIRRDKSTLLILPNSKLHCADKQSRIKNRYTHKRIAELQRTNINLSFSILS